MKKALVLTCFMVICLLSLATCGGSGVGVVSLQTQGEIANTAFLQDVAKTFYRTHPDQYDMLVIWGAEEFSPGSSFYLPVKNDIAGIGYRHVGEDIFDNSADYGSTVLQGIVWIGPDWKTNTDQSDGPRSNLGILAQETGHRWAATVYYRDAVTNTDTSALLEDGYHWNFYLNTGNSPLGGNQWESLGQSLYRALPAERVEFCPLDLYLMGLISAEDVGTITLLTSPRSQSGVSSPSKSIASAKTSEEVTVQATPQEISIEQIIAAEGSRGPDTGFNANKIRQVWIYVYNTSAKKNFDLNEIEQLRARWYDFFYKATGGKSEVDSVLH